MKQHGVAKVFGVPITGTNSAGGPWVVYGPFNVSTATATAGQRLETLEDTEEADVDELIDENGELIGSAVKRRRNTVTIDFIPVGVRDSDGKPVAGKNTLESAINALVLPGVWTKVTLANLPDTTGSDVGWNKDYIYRGGGSRSINADGDARVRLTLEDPSDVDGIGSPLSVTELTTVVS